MTFFCCLLPFTDPQTKRTYKDRAWGGVVVKVLRY
jgi:hypothetical protein